MNYGRIMLAVASASLLAACSSVIEGTSQEIVINTNPAGANCDLIREGISIARVSPTPGAATIKKTKHDITIKCMMPEYQEATYFNKSAAAGATFGNIILGGGIGWAIDSASGADNKYDSPVNITMVPILAPAAPAAPAGTVAPQTSEAAATDKALTN